LATYKEEESNNHQTNSNESTDIDWFWRTNTILQE
jgi:hypothetical protein